MAQRPKEEVRARIVEAAADAFSKMGFEKTTIALVADRAGVSIGNVYRYFEGKEQLFDAAVPAGFAAELKARTKAQVKALEAVTDVRLLAKDARYHVLQGELLRFALDNKARVVVLLARAEGTPFAGFAKEFRDGLVSWALEYAAGAWPDMKASRALRFALVRVYDAFLLSMAEALTAFEDEAHVREAIFHLTAHHQGGLKHLFELAARGGDHERGDHERANVADGARDAADAPAQNPRGAAPARADSRPPGPRAGAPPGRGRARGRR